MLKLFDGLAYTPPWLETPETGLELHMAQYAAGDMPMLQLMIEFEGDEGERLIEPYMTVTCNFPDADREPEELFIKNWSGNEGILEAMIEWGLLEKPERWFTSGFVEVPVCRMTPKLMLAVGDALIKMARMR